MTTMEHHYALSTEWTGNNGTGTDGYRNYGRNHIIRIEGKPDLQCSADPTFRGDKSKHNPEELLVAALSACHMLSYLHVCVRNGVVVTAYSDNATGRMVTEGDGGRMTEVTLHPQVTVRDADMVEKANSLHSEASKLCFIASSVNFPVRHEPTCSAG
ncbi:MAG: OsmC family protein [Flavobacteriales bacterium]|nr:MAG: OsmC family protein [Flavobacteriales bacterium]